MSQYVKVNGIKNLRPALERGARNIRKQGDAAVWKTAQQAVRPIRRRVPVAFGELKNSIQAYQRGRNGNPVTAVDAPHAGAVEIGSPPHKPNFERLLAWVKLRGLQALGPRGGLRRRIPASLGPTSGYQVPRVGKMIKSLQVRAGRGSGRHTPVDAAEAVARAISAGIEKRGTKPHWFVRESLEDIRQLLDANMKAAKDRAVDPTMNVKSGEMSDAGGNAVTWTPTMNVKDSELF